jgi:hypothetical protein
MFDSLRRLFSRRRFKQKAARATFRAQVEMLEPRAMMAIGSPTWISEGPFTISDPDTGAVGGNGAIQKIVVDPTQAGRAFAATVDGGVWRTGNLTAANPHWVPVTDTINGLAKPFLGMTDLAFSPLDPTQNTLFASTGRYSNTFQAPGPPVGVYKTTDGGNTWTNLGRATFGGMTITNVVPTRLTDPVSGGQVVFASATLTDPVGGTSYSGGKTPGVYRSSDGGQTWARLSGTNGLPVGDVVQLVADPGNANRFYAALPGKGIFLTSNGGATWAATGGNAQLVGVAGTNSFRIAIHNSAAANIVYVATVASVGQGQAVTGVYRSNNQGASWTRMALPGNPGTSVNPGGQGLTNVALAADPLNPAVVYIGGDQGLLFRGDATKALTLQWTSITGGAAGGTQPHSDSRSITFESSGSLLETDDGGVWRLTTPSAATRRWSYAGGDLAANASQFVAYDSVNHIIFGGAQDNGSPIQLTAEGKRYGDASSGDGQVAAVDNNSMPGFSIHYTSAQNGAFSRAIYNGSNALVGPGPLDPAASLGFVVAGTGGRVLSEIDPNVPFTTVLAVNAVDGKRLMVGTDYLYQSTDRGNNLTSLGGLTTQGQPRGDVGTVQAIAYGGRLNGVNNPDIAYVGTSGVALDGNTVPVLRLRTIAGGTFAPLNNYPGSAPLQIVLDPDNWRTAYIADDGGRIWRTTNAGVDFSNISGNLISGRGVTAAGGLRSMAIFGNTPAANDEVLFVGGFGGVAATDNTSLGANTVWQTFGTGLPNAAVAGLTYDATDNVLVAATFGRGFYEVKNLTNFAGHAAPVVKLGATTADYTTNFTVNGNAAGILDPAAAITAPASATLRKVTITITNPKDKDLEGLTVDTTGTNIVASAYNPTSGQLILSGVDSVANYKSVLLSVGYSDIATLATGGTRILNVVVNDGVASGRATTRINILGGTAAPQVVTTTEPATATVGTAASIHAGQLHITNADTGHLLGATVVIENLLDGAAEFLTAETAGTGISASYDPVRGVLTLRGKAAVNVYEQVLNSVAYENDAETPHLESREITFMVNDGLATSLADTVLLQLATVNHAPMVNPAATFNLDPVKQNDDDPVGSLVFDLVSSGDPQQGITDADPYDLRGIAVVGVDNTHGAWQYSTDGGDHWRNFSSHLSPSRAVLLTDDFESWVRFIPNRGFSGDVKGGLTFRAWDQTSDLPEEEEGALKLNGSEADTTENGDDSPFSTALGHASVRVYLPSSSAYVNAGWDLRPLENIADADPVTPGNQPAVFGITAFNLLSEGVDAVVPGGTVYVVSGDYSFEAIELTENVTLKLLGTTPTKPGVVTIGSLAGVLGATIDTGDVGRLANRLEVGDLEDSTTFSGAITGPGSLALVGGKLVLTGVSSYAGRTWIDGATLDLQGMLAGRGNAVILRSDSTLTSSTGSGRIADRGVVVASGESNIVVSNLADLANFHGQAVQIDGSAVMHHNTIHVLHANGIVVAGGGRLTLGMGNQVIALAPGATGLTVDGSASLIVGSTLRDTAFTGFLSPGSYYVRLTHAALAGPRLLDAGNATFEGIVGASLSGAALASAQSHISDYLENRSVGLVLLARGALLIAGPNLVVVGTAANDDISVSGSPGSVTIVLNGRTFGPRDVHAGRVVVYGLKGSDTIAVHSAVATQIFGGDDDDVILGGVGFNVIDGGLGDDVIVSRGTGDKLTGGGGRDTIVRKSG